MNVHSWIGMDQILVDALSMSIIITVQIKIFQECYLIHSEDSFVFVLLGRISILVVVNYWNIPI